MHMFDYGILQLKNMFHYDRLKSLKKKQNI